MSLNFTKEQERIFSFVQNEQGHGIIDAVAGAGKTTTIMECARFVQDKNDILFCAFNNSIAGDISKKFKKKDLHEVTVKTLHALGRNILDVNNNSGYPIKLQDNKYRELLNNQDIITTIRPYVEKIIRLNGYDLDPFEDPKKFALNNLVHRIKTRLLEINQKFRATLTKDDITDFKDLVIHYGIFNDTEIAKKYFQEELNNYFECHKILLNEGNSFSEKTMIIDFTDMLYLPFKWSLNPTKKFGFLFIDECQDLSKSQLAIALKYGKSTGRILAVGDPSQSIYGFTGADIESFNNVKKWTQAVELPLTTCFRCPIQVIDLARNIRKDIVGNNQNQGNIIKISFDDIVKIAKPGDLIISRFRDPIVLLVFSFIDKNIKVHVHEDEAREIINEIKIIFKHEELNMYISGNFAHLKKTVSNRWKWIITKNAEAITDSAERKIFIDNEMHNLEQKLNFLNKKYELWKSECNTLLDILQKIKDFISAPSDSIKLSTIHRAKGLENNCVFILNFDELPYQRLQQKNWEKIQEINLKYVALTRTLDTLYLIENKQQHIVEDEGSLFDNLPF